MGLFDTGSKGIKFNSIGDTVTGTITRQPREQQSTKFGTTDPDFWPNGDPKMQILVDLNTALREDADDDGDRTLYVSSTAQKKAIGDAMRTAGASDIEIGGTLTITYTGNDPQSKNPANPKKLYTASYVKPSSPLAQAAPAAAPAAQPVAAQAQVAPPAAAPAAPVVDEQTDKVRQLIGLALTDEQINAATGLPLANIAAIRAA